MWQKGTIWKLVTLVPKYKVSSTETCTFDQDFTARCHLRSQPRSVRLTETYVPRATTAPMGPIHHRNAPLEHGWTPQELGMSPTVYSAHQVSIMFPVHAAFVRFYVVHALNAVSDLHQYSVLKITCTYTAKVSLRVKLLNDLELGK